ncbi:hypothetical protein LOZ53_005071 [Ophidiomyces ophidiicola]|uniref:uncharacterized protein n=1 Tax=Ophidiomyces ophidiicola TaxID=1387563 RepID=UPI0020C38134|nr:uncharacterized protein LOZ57_003797 [Ophidiomyces ophidiicola]KAI1907225.1 hypothetical protein LOZ64_005965 [Ophidiomyces ophidiicola]KAI1935283.1 hypothetical protein LOZ62_006036 [Ophidiomyces ophidiicola]KAI1946542.1 hypothetical protein LOZ57_003797 [Ophidiomyces ophidiicola]KAI1970839.1 hypothetical protein LOZ55_006414 [Ophidiomyces ophidiicola]KAI1984487.1 hypothetical protein LOZ51_006647 [Ophidiomyces ophidiicola]
MTSTAQSQPNNTPAHHSQHQNPLTQKPFPANTVHSLPASTASYTADNHLAGLVEAATAAAGQNVGWTHSDDDDTAMAGETRALQNSLDGYTVGMQLEDSYANQGNAPNPHFILPPRTGPRPIAPAGGPIPLSEANAAARKRKRGDPNVDPSITGNPNFTTNSSETGLSNPNEYAARELSHRHSTSNTRVTGVYSAVALFRQPSATSKKYTRPPMSKLFTSLELSPENFLHLQAAAKAYMLDEDHPERRDCVGQRGKGDTEMVRLRLWNCVSDFLDKEGNGPRFFGENDVNEGMEPRQMVWPRDDQKIISLMMPLLRRMVTNERQRQYAIETRKGGSSEEKKRKQTEIRSSDSAAGDSVVPFQQPSETDVEILRLLPAGYPSEWQSITQCYESYNQNFRLDQLGAICGLPRPDWLGLIAAIDCHYQTDHHGHAAECDQPCLDCMVNNIVSSECVANANWRVGGSTDDSSVRTYFASNIIRDASHIIREMLVGRTDDQHDPNIAQPTIFSGPSNSERISPPPLPSGLLPTVSTTQSIQHSQKQSTNSARVIVNVVQNGDDKRLLPRVEFQGEQTASLSLLLTNARQYHQQRHQQPQRFQNDILSNNIRVRAWLKDGLTLIRNDEEWMAALMASHMVDWMDGELRVVLDADGTL